MFAPNVKTFRGLNVYLLKYSLRDEPLWLVLLYVACAVFAFLFVRFISTS